MARGGRRRRKQRSKKYSAKSKDRISDLSDDILYRLPIKDAIRTCVLSTRWRPVWTQFRRLSFTFGSDSTGRKFRTAGRLNDVLRRHAPLELTHLHIAVDTTPHYLGGDDESSVNYWDPFEVFEDQVDVLINFTRRENVEVLSLDLDQSPFDYLLWEICSPVLGSLRLYWCKIDGIDITSKNLKKLVIDGFWDDTFHDYEVHKVQVSVPFLEHLELRGCFGRVIPWKLIDVSSLHIANLDLHHHILPKVEDDFTANQTTVIGFIGKVSRAKELTIGTWCIKAISAWKMQVNVLPILYCKCLILHLCGGDKYVYPGVESLLQSSLTIEKLVLDFRGKNYVHCDDVTGYWESPRSAFNCLTHHLKIIHVHGLPRENFDIVEFLLKHAMVLEEMVIHIESGETLDKLRLSKKLLDLPRSSSAAVVRLPDDVDKTAVA